MKMWFRWGGGRIYFILLLIQITFYYFQIVKVITGRPAVYSFTLHLLRNVVNSIFFIRSKKLNFQVTEKVLHTQTN